MTTSAAELTRSEIEARILVVDDEPEIATLVAEALQVADPSWDISVETDARRALERLSEDDFDCLVTDLVMPNLSGLALAHEARAACANLAMVAVTGQPCLEASVEAMRLGFTDFIQKPFDLETLQEAVSRAILNRRREMGRPADDADAAEAPAVAADATREELSRKLDLASHDLVLSQKRLARQIEDVAMTADVARSLLGVVELEDLLGLCAELIGDRVTCRTSTIALYEPQESAVGLMIRAYPDAEEPPALCWLRQPLKNGALCRAAQSGKSIHVEDAAASALVQAAEKEFWPDGHMLIVPIMHQGGAVGVAVLHRRPEDQDFGAYDVKTVTELAKVMGPAIRTAKNYHRQRCMMYASLEAVADAVERRDPYLKGHAARVLAYSMQVAQAMDLAQCQIGAVQIAARLHDIGRLMIPESAIHHPGPLNETQWDLVHEHPEAGAALLKPLDFFGEVGEIIRSHHESYDGTGYPHLKAGEEIPLVARVIAVADAFDAMTSPRPYREALSVEDALDQIRQLSGQQFDPQAADALLAMPMETLKEISESAR